MLSPSPAGTRGELGIPSVKAPGTTALTNNESECRE